MSVKWKSIVMAAVTGSCMLFAAAGKSQEASKEAKAEIKTIEKDGLLLSEDGKTLIRPMNSYGTTYTIPNSVTSIGGCAFENCWNLDSITIPDSVTSIENAAFSNCSNLTRITIPDSVTSIGDRAFYLCSGLFSITIPSSVTSIGDGAFSGQTKLRISPKNQHFTQKGGVLFDKNKKVLYRYPSYKSGGYVIPNSVTSIGGDAFKACYNLTSITIPDSVTSIGDGAFSGCDKLTSITIPNSVTSIGEDAFRGCSNLTSITIPDSVTSIGDGAFSGCKNLNSITISDGHSMRSISTTDLRHLEKNLNQNSVKKDDVLFSKDMKFLYRCLSCKSGGYVIPDSVTSIGEDAFKACHNLTSITIPNSVTSIGEGAFSYCGKLISITIPNSVTSIGDGAFKECSKLTSITIPNSVTSIGVGAFSGCDKLTSITIPDSVTSIREYAFKECPELTVTISEATYNRLGAEKFNEVEVNFKE